MFYRVLTEGRELIYHESLSETDSLFVLLHQRVDKDSLLTSGGKWWLLTLL